MILPSFSAGQVASQRSSDNFVTMRNDMAELQRQLSTGKKSDSFGGLGFERRSSLDLRAKLSTLDSYKTSIEGADTRIKLMMQSVERLSKISSETRSDVLLDRFDLGLQGATTASTNAQNRIKEAIDLLNGDYAGRRLFAGRAVDVTPVQSYARIMDGDAVQNQDGLKTLIAERKAADGAGGLGRLTLTPPAATGTAVTLSEDANPGTRQNFGFRILAGTATGTGIVSTSPTPGAPGVALAFAAQPASGEVSHILVNQADGTQKTVDLKAGTDFNIGGTAADTRDNLVTALGAAGVAMSSIVGATSAASGLSASFSGGAASVKFDVTAQPADGDVVKVVLAMRDGTQETLELTARAGASAAASATEFKIGASATDTAANLASALDAAVRQKAQTALPAASATIASADFFAGSAGTPPRRIAGPPVDDAVGFAPPGTRKTLIWYKGDDTAPSARETAPLRVDATQTVATGAQANEPALRNLFAQLGAMAAQTFSSTSADQHSSDPNRKALYATEAAQYSSLVDRTRNNLALPGAQSIDDIAAELGNAAAAMDNAKERHASTSVILQGALDGVENASPEATVASLLSLQTRMQASYQTTSILAKLSLVNYL